MIRELRFLAPGSVSLESEGHKYPPKGTLGGSDGTPSELLRKKANGEEIHLPSKLPHHAFSAGDSITAIRACGGGYAPHSNASRRMSWMTSLMNTSPPIRLSNNTRSGSSMDNRRRGNRRRTRKAL